MDHQRVFNLSISTFGGIMTFIFGGWDICLYVLAAFMVLDYGTGVFSAYITGKVNSQTGFKGILRKSEIFVVLAVGTLLDRLLNEGTWIFRTVVCYYYIANEGISIFENCGKSGLPLPKKIVEALEQLKNK
ncbi:phage holin family protein [Clostridium kluyveri]|uniref:Predicted holin protein n=2 Tax=Clostridium kluyveri TaxID=1534 RepID=A5F9L6_CLOK5|nr:phage holin family protein [Clostridium kluyveri]ABQ23650.1 predicted holin protein [Clostridium kluyveri DSM 555]EDK35247.1 Hypothetical protein CKL_3244 [Clostridium kluyveri DSM 555]BAH07921.1 hypothetical protein CKR_2870 [Clostridium kluyveri NBRC 12016]BAH08526.1 hypothetical protein CKR_P07 [Clostridium kluyveri NBRC 12016]